MLQYKDGGLRNVWLANGYEVRQTRHGEAVSIRDQEGLTRAICLALKPTSTSLIVRDFLGAKIS